MKDTKIQPRWSKRKIDEAYDHMKPYFKEDTKLQTMCAECPHFKSANHSYAECKGKMCFTFYLAYEYLEWSSSYD